MMTIDEIRRENLAALIKELGGVSTFAEKIAKSDSQVSQWRNASVDSKTKKPRGISDDACRDIEEKCGKPRGWMDNNHNESAIPPVSPDKLMQLVAAYATMDEESRSMLLDFAETRLPEGAVIRSTANNHL
jgi:hypothetical protein